MNILYWVIDVTDIDPYFISPHPHPQRQQKTPARGANKLRNNRCLIIFMSCYEQIRNNSASIKKLLNLIKIDREVVVVVLRPSVVVRRHPSFVVVRRRPSSVVVVVRYHVPAYWIKYLNTDSFHFWFLCSGLIGALIYLLQKLVRLWGPGQYE